MYCQRYVKVRVVNPTKFQVSGGQLQISAFGSVQVMVLSLLVNTILHIVSDGLRISFPLFHYVDYLFHRSWLVRWSAIFLRQFCFSLYHCRA